MPKPRNPHLRFPFQVPGSSVPVLEQDTVDEIAQCAELIWRTPLGFRIELPEFGVRDQTFALGGVDKEELMMALAQWEPRAEAAIIDSPDLYDELVNRVSARVTVRASNG